MKRIQIISVLFAFCLFNSMFALDLERALRRLSEAEESRELEAQKREMEMELETRIFDGLSEQQKKWLKRLGIGAAVAGAGLFANKKYKESHGGKGLLDILGK
ncbi:hypothetical protein SNEBB_004543 [Seison nebaliae]|nr:hypothetical protein SNEBB_004543 [Seison nebaliae]